MAPTSEKSTSQNGTARALRRLLLAVYLIGAIGIAAELAITIHVETIWQQIPLYLLGASLVALVWRIFDHRWVSLRFWQLLMVLMILSGVLGIYLHHDDKMEFQLELYPDLPWKEHAWKALLAHSPPALAPGAMILLGLIGLLYTFRHPALSKQRVKDSTTGDA
jgi:hypothetical protein